jgi:hypothetical protein
MATADAYVQVFRNGSVEAVDAHLIPMPWPDHPGKSHVPSERYEQALIAALPRYLSAQETLGVEPPLIVILSLLGVAGYVVSVSSRNRSQNAPYPIDRDVILAPEIELDSFQCDAAAVLRPAFDAVANAGGWPQSPNYNEAGVWIAR